MISISLFSRAACAVTLASLAACGGGGGGGVAGVDATVANGFGAKGIIKKGKVLVCRISGGKAQDDASCTTGVTADDGSYSVRLSDGWTGPVLVKVLPATGSKMLDETNGEYVDFDIDGGIRAVVATSSTPAHVTPFSEIAANAALKETTLDATAINNARAMVQANFGVDLSTKPVVDLKSSSTDADALGKQIAMVQKLAQVVNASKTSGELKDPVTNNACASVACGIKAMNAMATSTTLVQVNAGTTMTTVFAAPVNVHVPIRKTDGTIFVQKIDPARSDDIQSTLESAGLAADTASSLAPTIKSTVAKEVSSTNTQLAELKNKTADKDGNANYTPPSTTQLASMDQAKAMVNFLREALSRFSNPSETGYLDKQGARFQKETQTVIRPAVESDLFRMKAIELGTKLFDSVQTASAGLQTVAFSNGKTYYFTYTNSADDGSYWFGNHIACTIEKVSTDQSKVPVICRAVGSGTSWQPVTISYGYATYFSSSTNVASAITDAINFYKTLRGRIAFTFPTIRIVITPQSDGSLSYSMTKETENLYYSGAFNPQTGPSYYMDLPVSNLATNTPAGPYNYDATTGVNTYNANCLTSITAGYDTSKTKRDSTSGSSTCTPWVGTGKVERTKGSGDTWAALRITGTMPPSQSQAYENPLSVGYDTVAVSLASTTVGTTDMKYAVTGSVAAYETAKKGTVEVDATQW